MSIKLSDREIDIIHDAMKPNSTRITVFSSQEVEEYNNAGLSLGVINSVRDVLTYTKEEIWLLIDRLSDLIGYDRNTHDIDSLGKEADGIISKLLGLLRQRGEM